MTSGNQEAIGGNVAEEIASWDRGSVAGRPVTSRAEGRSEGAGDDA